MGHIRIALIGLSLILVYAADAGAQDSIRDLVVKIHAVHQMPDLLHPWTKNSPQQVKGSGVVIEGKRILTNAHVVRYASQIYVQPNQSADRIAARVEAVSPAMDLAVLKLDDTDFFNNRGTLPFAEELPRVKDAVSVYGYPTGGSELSVTQGIVSRIEFTDYYYQTSGLRIQVDAALNFGNSGGPAVNNGRLVGLVFSLIQNAQNIGYLIPVEEIKLFLSDIADGAYDGKPQMHDLVQTIENDALKRKLGLPKDVNGMMVTEPYRDGDSYPLKEWDVITHIGDTPVDNDAKVTVRYDLRLSAYYLVQKYAKNGRLPLTVFREGRTLRLELPVQAQRDLVIPYMTEGNPRYFILGPLVFSQTTQDYLDRLGNQRISALSRRSSPLLTRRFDKPAFPGEEIVVIAAPLFPHRITNGYDDPNNAVVTEVNEIPVKNLRHLVEIIRDAQSAQITFKFARSGGFAHESMVFNRDELMAATGKVLEENGIRYPFSADLRAVWETTISAAPRAVAAECCLTR
jgi:S1-C subfamily serine protease